MGHEVDSMRTTGATCGLCEPSVGGLLWQDDRCRVVLVEDEGAKYPGYCRVIWKNHVAEMTQLSRSDRCHLMDVVFAVERALCRAVQPDKINLASLGNMTPHLHWHVIPRWVDDVLFPLSIWSGPPRRDAPDRPSVDSVTLARFIEVALSGREAEA